jgi:hypothetical protein
MQLLNLNVISLPPEDSQPLPGLSTIASHHCSVVEAKVKE